jgi:hypothetical protein
MQVEINTLVTVVLGLVALEFGALTALFLHRRRGFSPVALALKLFPGICLILALRAALLDQDDTWIVFWLTAAGLTHLLDLWRNWPRR